MRLTPFLLVLCACSSTLTEEQRYERDNRRVMAKEAYELKRRACEEEGGYMVVVHRHGVNTREIPQTSIAPLIVQGLNNDKTAGVCPCGAGGKRWSR